MIRVMILWGLGINCEEETESAYRLAGAHTTLVHVNELFNEKYRVHDFQLVHFPGGFSFGDHLGAGRVLANRFRFKRTKKGTTFRQELMDFAHNGGFIFGICNGFQILVSLGLLPGFSTDESLVSLIHNQDGNFHDSWVSCRFVRESPVAHLWPYDEIYLPVRHGEGRLVVLNDSVKTAIKEQKLIAMTYVDDFNGSFEHCAALSDSRGRVLGMMPHPEAFLSPYNHPEWCGKKELPKAMGLMFFKNLVGCMGVSNAVAY